MEYRFLKVRGQNTLISRGPGPSNIDFQWARDQKRAATLDIFKFSVRLENRVRVLGAPRPLATEGSSFPRCAPGKFEFWVVRRDPARQRVQVFRARHQEGSSSEARDENSNPLTPGARKLERFGPSAD